MIVFRYFAREVYATVFSVTLVLVFVFLIQQSVRYLGMAANGHIAATAIFTLMGLELPYLLGLLLPLGLYFGVLIAYGRFYADHEMTVLFSSGMSRAQLTKITLGVSAVIFVLVAVLMLFLNPFLASQKNKIVETTAASNIVATLVPGEFKISNDGSKIIYVGGVTQDHKKATDLFIAEQPSPKQDNNNSDNGHIMNQAEGWTITSAKHGYVENNAATDSDFVVAEQGYRYQGSPGKKDFFTAQFKEYGVQLPKDKGTLKRDDTDAMSTIYLIRHQKEALRLQVEMQWRIALPISVFLFAILAMQLSKAQPRQGRFQKFIPAVLIYVVYANLMFVGKDWMSHGTTPAWLGLWWVHFSLLGLVLLIAWFQR